MKGSHLSEPKKKEKKKAYRGTVATAKANTQLSSNMATVSIPYLSKEAGITDTKTRRFTPTANSPLPGKSEIPPQISSYVLNTRFLPVLIYHILAQLTCLPAGFISTFKVTPLGGAQTGPTYQHLILWSAAFGTV